LYGFFKIKWNKYRVNLISGISIIFSTILFTAYKMTVIFMDDDETYFGISAIFLTANGMIMIVTVFLNNPQGALSINEVVNKLPEGPPLDIMRSSNYDDEITDAYEKDDYIPTQNEIFEMFTVNRVIKKIGVKGVFEGGFSKLFLNQSK